jgi:hypothetical protein
MSLDVLESEETRNLFRKQGRGIDGRRRVLTVIVLTSLLPVYVIATTRSFSHPHIFCGTYHINYRMRSSEF